jgi:hypothetical protein
MPAKCKYKSSYASHSFYKQICKYKVSPIIIIIKKGRAIGGDTYEIETRRMDWGSGSNGRAPASKHHAKVKPQYLPPTIPTKKIKPTRNDHDRNKIIEAVHIEHTK